MIGCLQKFLGKSSAMIWFVQKFLNNHRWIFGGCIVAYKKLEVYENIVTLLHPIIVDIIKYRKLSNEIREPFPEFKTNKLKEIRNAFRSFHPNQFYIEPLSVGLRLANLNGDLVKIFYDDYLATDEFIEKVNMDFGYLNAIKTNDILGVEHSQKYMTEENLNLLKRTNWG